MAEFALGVTWQLQQELCTKGTPVQSGLTGPTVFQIKYETLFEDKDKRIRRCQVGKAPNIPVAEKVMLMVGETGSGKSATINSIVNFVYGVRYGSKFRIRLVDENEGDSAAKSQTEWITAYTLHYQKGFQFDYSLTLVDTPGYGATQGSDRDLEITSQLREYFNHLVGSSDYLSAVCFVTKSSETRLQQYKIDIYKALLDLFGGDLAQNIIHIFTFAGGKKNPKARKVMEEMGGIPFVDWYCIDNDAVQEVDEDEDADIRLFEKTYHFLLKLSLNLETMIDTSMSQTRETLVERDQLQNNVKNLQKLFKTGYYQLDKLNTYKTSLEESKATGNENKMYTIREPEKISKENVEGSKAINCKICESTCHHPCKVPFDILKWFCHIIDWRGKCTLTSCKHSWTDHTISTTHYDQQITEKKVSVNDIVNMYKPGGKQTRELEVKDSIKNIENELKDTKKKMKDEVKSIIASMKRLDEIALRPCQFKETEYIDEEIKTIKKTKDPGWEARVNLLEDFKKSLDSSDE